MSNVTLDPGEKLAAVNRVKLCYQTFGNPDDPALLLIMGLGAQMILWPEGFCDELAARGFWVIRFDNRDVGKSSKIEIPPLDIAKIMFSMKPGDKIDAPYLLADMAADSVGLLDVLGVAQAHIVGASMGGMIAQEIAIRHPRRVLSLTSIMSTSGDPSLPPPSPHLASIFLAPPPRTAEEYVEANVIAFRVLRGEGYPEEEARDLALAARAAGRGFDPAGGARQLTAILASGSRRATLPTIKAPTLVIHAADDPLVPLAAGEDTARCIPGAKLVVIDRMGHSLPGTVWKQIIDEIVRIAR